MAIKIQDASEPKTHIEKKEDRVFCVSSQDVEATVPRDIYAGIMRDLVKKGVMEPSAATEHIKKDQPIIRFTIEKHVLIKKDMCNQRYNTDNFKTYFGAELKKKFGYFGPEDYRVQGFRSINLTEECKNAFLQSPLNKIDSNIKSAIESYNTPDWAKWLYEIHTTQISVGEEIETPKDLSLNSLRFHFTNQNTNQNVYVMHSSSRENSYVMTQELCFDMSRIDYAKILKDTGELKPIDILYHAKNDVPQIKVRIGVPVDRKGICPEAGKAYCISIKTESGREVNLDSFKNTVMKAVEQQADMTGFVQFLENAFKKDLAETERFAVQPLFCDKNKNIFEVLSMENVADTSIQELENGNTKVSYDFDLSEIPAQKLNEALGIPKVFMGARTPHVQVEVTINPEGKFVDGTVSISIQNTTKEYMLTDDAKETFAKYANEIFIDSKKPAEERRVHEYSQEKGKFRSDPRDFYIR